MNPTSDVLPPFREPKRRRGGESVNTSSLNLRKLLTAKPRPHMEPMGSLLPQLGGGVIMSGNRHLKTPSAGPTVPFPELEGGSFVSPIFGRTASDLDVASCHAVISLGRDLLPRLAEFYQMVGKLDEALLSSTDLQSAFWAVKRATIEAELRMIRMQQLPDPATWRGHGRLSTFDSLECFTVLEQIGRGAFANVHLARHNASGRSVVLKVIGKRVTESREWENLKGEGDLLARLQHPFIVRLYSSIVAGNDVYYVMEYVSGGEMFKYIRERGKLTEDCARFYAASMVLVVEYLNGLNIIHRDIKPENVVLDQHGYMKLVDFGFAKFVPDRASAVVGTPDYLAPEVIKMRGYTKAVDIWALGVYIFEMTHGYSPFHGTSKMETFVNILQRDPPISATASLELRDLLLKLLSKDTTWRLGNTSRGFAELKEHPFFISMDWDALYNRELEAPIQPTVTSAWDTENFVKAASGRAVEWSAV